MSDSRTYIITLYLTYFLSEAASCRQCFNCRNTDLLARHTRHTVSPQRGHHGNRLVSILVVTNKSLWVFVLFTPCREPLRLHKRFQLPQAGSGYATPVPPAKLKHVLQPLFQTPCRRQGRCQIFWQLQSRHCSLSPMKMPATSQQPWSTKHPSCWHSWLTCCSNGQALSCRVVHQTVRGATCGFWSWTYSGTLASPSTNKTRSPNLWLVQFLDQLNRAGGVDRGTCIPAVSSK